MMIVDPDGKVRDRTMERDQYLGDVKAEIRFLNSLQPGRILDIGCGLGFLLSALPNTWEKHGVEPNRFAAEYASQWGTILHGEFEEASYRDSYFDVIVMHHVIEHMREPEKALAKVRSLLKPAGILLLGTPDFDSPCARRFNVNYRLLHDQTHVSLFTRDSMRDLLENSGFVIDKLEFPYFETRHFTEENLLRLFDTSKVSPPFVGNYMTFYCHKPKGVLIGDRLVGDGEPCFIVAEIGINHNGNLDTAWQLIDAAVDAGVDAVKFQKRTVDVVYGEEDLAKPRESPFGSTNGDLKRALEFNALQYAGIQHRCAERGVMWFASCWDVESVDMIDQFSPPAYKIASACLTEDALLRHIREKGRPVILSTGMSTIEQIDHAVGVLGRRDLVILHCTSTYPCQPAQLNLRCIPMLKKRYQVPVGYSGHEVGLQTTEAAVALGACMVERHITLDRAMWGSDQAASVEPQGFERLVRNIRSVEMALGNGVKKVYEGELPILKKLRKIGYNETLIPKESGERNGECVRQ